MNTLEIIDSDVDRWIEAEDLSPHGSCKVLSRFAGLYPEDPEENEAYWDFIHWAMNREHALLLSLPQPRLEPFFPPRQIDEQGADISPYNTVDFKRLYRVNSNQWRLKYIIERVRDLAQTYSCIGQIEGQENIYKRFRELIKKEFRVKINSLIETLKKASDPMEKQKISSHLAILYREVGQCQRVWDKHMVEG